MFLVRHKINEKSPDDSVNEYTTRFLNHFVWFLMFELLLSIMMPIFLAFFIVHTATDMSLNSIDGLVVPRDLYLLFAALLCGHLAEIVEKNGRPGRA